MPTKQETFDVVARHLLTQMRRSTAAVDGARNSICAYRGDAGCKCAAGVLIPDDKYTPFMEGRGVDVGSLAGRTIVGEGHDISLVRLLQDVHDSSDPSRWKEKLAAVALTNGLNTDVLKEFA